MISRYRFHSDTNRAQFEDDLWAANVESRAMGDEVTVTGIVPFWAHQLALDGGATLTTDDPVTSTSGVDGFLDTGSTSTRSAPPPEIWGLFPPDHSKQIVNQQPGIPPRRTTRGQP